MSDMKRIIEVGGVKVEVDLRDAKTISTYKVGDGIKLLKKQYGDSWTEYYGVIVGFAEFATHPSIEILYLSNQYGDNGITFLCVNAETKDVEIAPLNEYEASFSRTDVLAKIDGQILAKEEEVRQLQTKKNAFQKFFGTLMQKES